MVAQIAKYVYGPGPLAHVLYVALQAGTMLILVLAANTSFTGFPFLASFAAADSYLPRAAHPPRPPARLLHRDHRADRGLDRPAGGHRAPRWTT